MKLIAAILAGGESRRMGQDKALLPLGDSTLLNYMQRKLEAANLFENIVVCRKTKSDRVTNKYLPDIHPGLGPIGALYTLSVHYPLHLILVVPVDMPLLQSPLLEELCRAGITQHSTYYFEGHHFPLMLCTNDITISCLAERLEHNTQDLSIASLLRDIAAKSLAPPRDGSQLANLNSPQEWQSFCRELDIP